VTVSHEHLALAAGRRRNRSQIANW